MSTIHSTLVSRFAQYTVTCGDLDPMYDLIYRAGERYGEQWKYQFALQFFMYYDAGQAAALANAKTELDFWHMNNYGYEHFKRGTERRHFRGEKGRQAMLRFQHMGGPEQIWKKMYRPTYPELVRNIEENFQGCQVGPYFTWKAMDFFDRCFGWPVELDRLSAVKYMPSEPIKCALTLWPDRPVADTLDWVVEQISDYYAPGKIGKYCSYAEAETVLCMIKGFFLTKTHTVGDDIDEKHAQLKDHPYLLEFLPPKLSDYHRNSYVKALDPTSVPA